MKRPSYTSEMSYVVTKIVVACVLVRFFFFSLPLIVTSLTASVSHFLTASFHVFLPTKFVSFVLYLALYLFPCYTRQ